jgi:hypothetical protein
MIRFDIGEYYIPLRKILLSKIHVKPGTVIQVGNKLYIRTKDNDYPFFYKGFYPTLTMLWLGKQWDFYYL